MYIIVIASVVRLAQGTAVTDSFRSSTMWPFCALCTLHSNPSTCTHRVHAIPACIPPALQVSCGQKPNPQELFLTILFLFTNHY